MISMGQRISVNAIVQNGELVFLYKTNSTKGVRVDYCLVGVDYNNKILDDDYFIFYNQDASREQSLQKKHGENVFAIDFNSLPRNISKLVLTATASSEYNIGDIESIEMQLYNTNNYYIDSYMVNGNNYRGIKTVVIAEINNINGMWFFNFIGANFMGGLKEIIELFGGNVEGGENTSSENCNNLLNMNKQENIQKLVLKKAPQLLNMTKTVALVLEKKKIADVPARVAVVLDYSASMRSMYESGLVQKVLDRMLPVAMQLDDNGEMEIWIFEKGFHRLKDISLDNINNYIVNEQIMKKYKFGGTCYAPVIEDVISKYIYEEPSQYPALILFITDGDNFRNDKKKTTKLITQASTMPIFWQFVGIGDSSFDYLQKLDEMQGRFIDNANFFSVNDINEISDEELYNRLLNEFPYWINEARNKNIIR